MSRISLFKLYADAIKNAIAAGLLDNALRRAKRRPGKPRARRAYAHGPGSLGEYDAQMRAYLDSGRVGARPSRFVAPRGLPNIGSAHRE